MQRQTRSEQVEEAERIYECMLFQRELAGKLIRKCAKAVIDKEDRVNVRADLYMIVTDLAAAAASGSRNPVWESYQHHFIGHQSRVNFFNKLRRLARDIASRELFITWNRRQNPDNGIEPPPAWDSSLLPSRIASHVLRLAILHPGILEDFLPQFFVHASDLLAEKATYRRATLILQAVPRFGWSAEKHTEMLIDLGSITAREDASERETVKKFIRDLRRRYRNYVRSAARRASALAGTSSPEKP